MQRDTTDGDATDRTNRRRFLKTVGAVGIAGLAGCGGDGDGTATETPTPEETETPTETTAGETPTATEATGTTPGDTATETPTETATPGQNIPPDPPSIVTFSGGGSVSPGGTTTLTGSIQNPYLFPLRNVEVSLTAPEGLSISADGSTTFDELETQATAEITWEISAPEDADGEYTVSGTVGFESATDSAETDVSHTVVVFSAGDVPGDGLEAYFSFDGDAATNAVTGTDGEVTGDPTTDASGVVNGAWEFTTDGSRTSTVDAVTSGEELPLNGEGATVACWINFTDHEPFGRLLQVGGDIATNTVDAPGHEIVFDNEADALYIYAKTASSSIPVSPETWYFVVGVVDGTDARLHVFNADGEIDASPVSVDDMRSPTDGEPLVMMSGDDSETAGRLDEVRAYSRALSEQEILELYGGSGGAG
jgi:hypothetical protein